MAKRISLSNGRVWNTQKVATDHFRTLRDRYPDGVPIEDASDHSDLVALVERFDAAHGKNDSKAGSGIGHFEVRTNTGAGGATRGFWVIRTDGSETDFSFIWAIRGEPKPLFQEFADACRAAVLSDIRTAKRVFFDEHADELGFVECEISGDLLTFEEAHVDHADPTFSALVVAFREERGWHSEVPEGTLSDAADGQFTTTFASEEVAMAFRIAHYRNAELRIISGPQNLSRSLSGGSSGVKRPLTLADPEKKNIG